ncbi:glycosyl transferase [Flavobacterium album]|uniref:Glycosyl transferase n=1 Tax=Flavobacterium album TaxID=2175091 RepID=A0A2S1QY11_9FLAO|nr:glycosyltransferase [Flavobacterium album]AWH85131.1 glycosyl transferase [Flavobacterium album]
MENNKLKVCFLIPSVYSGGIETYLLRFLNYLSNSMDVTVIVRKSTKGELYDDYIATGAKLVFMPLGYFEPGKMVSYYRFFKKNRFDVVCDFNANFAGLPMFLSKLAGVKKRITFYRQGSHHFKKTAFRVAYTNFLNRLVYKYSTHIFANSVSGLKFFFGDKYPADPRFKVIRNGVGVSNFSDSQTSKSELREKLELPRDKFIVGHTGRFAEAKNHFFLLDVAQKLLEADKDFYFVLIGNNTDKLIPYSEKLGIRDSILFLGFKANIPEYLKAFDAFFFPSVTEGQPNALIEAMISGLPIVASDIGPIMECMPENDTKSLVSPTDVPAATQKILEVKQNPEKFTYQKFASENFDAKVQFKIFKDSLLHH